MFALLMGLKTISPEALHKKMKVQPVRVFDLNSPQSWATARLPGAVRLEPGAWGDAELPPAKNAPLVFYCSNPLCRKAPNAAKRAKKLGYTDVAVLAAGISGWLADGLPTDSGA